MAESKSAPAAITTSAAFRQFVETQRRSVDAALEALLPSANTMPTSLHQAMRHSIFAGGKRLRPLLALAGATACDAAPEGALPAACAVELIHTYSLIHDDLPAFDDESLRRGHPTCHVVFGEAVAILAGDALQALAFEALATAGRNAHADRWTAASEWIARAAGSGGMCGGQTLDIEAAGTDLDLASLRHLHAAKTGALLTAAVVSGGIVAGGDDLRIAALRRYGDAVGLAFQIVDDLLDVEGSAEQLGKTPGGDAARGQPTFPALIGMARARAEAETLRDRAIDALAPLGAAAEPLRGLAALIVDRTG